MNKEHPLISEIFKLIEEKNSLINLFDRYKEQIDKRDSLIKVQKAMIKYLESELKKVPTLKQLVFLK